MRPILAAAALIALVSMATAHGAERSVTLAVDGLTCPSCPYMVKQSLAEVDGVSRVSVSYAEKKARVTFDDAKTDATALMAATAGIGFPSRVAGE